MSARCNAKASSIGTLKSSPPDWLSVTHPNPFDSFTALVLGSIAESSGEVETSLLGL